MKSFLLGIFLTVFLYGCCQVLPPPYPASAQPEDIAPVQKVVSEDTLYHSFVKLQVSTRDGTGTMTATGFAIDNESIITAAHFCVPVVEGIGLVIFMPVIDMVYLNNNDELAMKGNLEIVAIDEKADLCLLQRKHHGLVPLRIVPDYRSVKIGDKVRILGSPLGVFPADTEGRVISPMFEDIDDKLLTTAPATSGNSGGPVINSRLEVIGILIAGFTNYEHITIATTADELKEFLKGSGK